VRKITQAVAICGVTFLAGCAYYSPSQVASERNDATHQLANGADKSDAQTDALHGQSAAQRGDWLISAAFSGRSFKQTPNMTTEFNLATAYQHTGRADLAIPLYIDIAERGQYLKTVPLLNADGTWPLNLMSSTYADEASKRLLSMGARPESLPQSAPGHLITAFNTTSGADTGTQ